MPPPFAALPMYDRPELGAAHDALWAAIRDRLRAGGTAAPDALDRERGLFEGWRDPGLVLGQACSLPYRAMLRDAVTVIGTFDYALPETAPGYYHSVIATPAGALPDSIATARIAINQPHSQSGWAAMTEWLAPRRALPETVLETGGHRATAVALAEGRADLGAIDAVTWRLIERFEPDLAARIDIVDRSARTPALPLIAAAGSDGAAIAAAVAAGLAAVPAAAAALGIAGFVPIPADTYLALPMPPPAPGHAPNN
ncbi:phosphate/phosphite/phosphonate ABC transporter substrate-binding protein [Frigidibacter sp. MR17.24]|uniref:phosphate/phosphite/phosphonate ABC transporter substrate-binding protein n=1 Tax=Frigidibacter sp. MR17.24 TaxID=3127345 RepID=UPI0030129DF5